MQKISSIHKLIQQILGSHELNDYTHFWPGPPKNHWNNFLLSWICTTMQKISSFDQFIVEIQPVLWPDWPHPFLAMPIQKIFDQLLIYVNLYQHANNQAICSGEMVDYKILQSDWLRTFLSISQEPEFSQIWDLCRNITNNIHFHYRTNSVRINDKIFHIQKTLFLAHFPNFWDKKFFSRKFGCHALHMGF